MRKACFIVALILTFGFNSSFAQTLDVEWGGLTDLEKKTQFDKVAGQDGDKYYLVRVEKEKPLERSRVWLESISKTTNGVDGSYELTLPEVYNKKTVYENLFYLNEKLILFVAVLDNIKQRRNLYAYHIDEDGTTKGEALFLGSIPIIGNTGSLYNYTLTPDKKKIIIEYNNPFTTYTGEPFVFKVIDSDLKLVEKKEFQMPYLKRQFDVMKYERGESGDYYFALRLHPAKSRRASRPGQAVKYEFKMMVFNMKRDSFLIYPITMTKFTPRTMTFALDDEENVIIFGQGTKRSAPAIAAVFYQKLNPKIEKFEVKAFRDFSKDRAFLAEFQLERNGTGPGEWFSYTPGEILFLHSAGIVYLTEQHYVTTRKIVDPKTKEETSVYYHNYGDILAVSVDDDNQMNWHTKVPKMQFSTNDNGYYSSYAATVDVNKIKLIFNDNQKNFGRVPYAKIKEVKFNVSLAPSGQAALATIYSDGNVDKAEMFQKSDRRVNVCPRLFIEHDGQFFIYGQERSDFKFGNFFFE
jgi:hypothetical protein